MLVNDLNEPSRYISDFATKSAHAATITAADAVAARVALTLL